MSKEPDYAEYRKAFLPFNVTSYTVLPPSSLRSTEELDSTQAKIDAYMVSPAVQAMSISEHAAPFKQRRGFSPMPVKALLEKMEGREENTIDLTNDAQDSYSEYVRMLRETPIKYLFHPRDVRPPYCGTWTKPLAPEAKRALPRNPCKKVVESLNYDYDSEAEWEEPEEGEELGSDGEEDLDDEEDEDDMDGFVDDENDAGPAKGLNTTELQIQSTGLCWEHPSGLAKRNDGSGEAVDLAPFQMEVLLDPLLRTIDPFATSYWQKAPKRVTPTLLAGQTRLPLGNAANGVNRLVLPNQSPSAQLVNARQDKKPTAPKVPKRFVGDSDIDTFKSAVKGRTETKQQLVPILYNL